MRVNNLASKVCVAGSSTVAPQCNDETASRRGTRSSMIATWTRRRIASIEMLAKRADQLLASKLS